MECPSQEDQTHASYKEGISQCEAGAIISSGGGPPSSKRKRDGDLLDDLWDVSITAGGSSGFGKDKDDGNVDAVAAAGAGADASGGAENDLAAGSVSAGSGGTPMRKLKKERRSGHSLPSGQAQGSAMDVTRRKQMDLSIQIRLAAEQYLNYVKDEKAVFTITDKGIEDHLKRVNSRLTDALLKVYTKNYHEGAVESDEGMNLLASLNSMKNSLEIVKPLARSLCATSGELASATTLLQSLRHLESKSFHFPKALFEMVLTREATMAFDEKRWADWSACLSRSTSSDKISLSTLGTDGHCEVQCRLVLKGLLSCVIELPSLQQEIANLLLRNPFGIGIDEANRIKTLFLSDQTLKLHQALKHFPSGKSIIDKEGVAIQQMNNDKTLESELDALEKAEDGKFTLITENGLDVLDAEALQRASKTRSSLESLRAKASEHFMAKKRNPRGCRGGVLAEAFLCNFNASPGAFRDKAFGRVAGGRVAYEEKRRGFGDDPHFGCSARHF